MSINTGAIRTSTNLASATAYAQNAFTTAGERGTAASVRKAFAVRPVAIVGDVAPATGTPPADALNTLLNNVGAAPGATTIVTLPAAPASGDLALVQNVQTLDSYIATLTALVQYNKHPDAYDLSDKQQASQFVIDLANARNFVVTGGTIKAIPMYLPMGEASTQTISKSTTSADLHVDLLNAMFGALSLPAAVLTEMDGILTEVSSSLANLQLSFETQTQTLDHFVSFYQLVPVVGSNPVINQMNVMFIFLQMQQSAWKASLGKSSISHFTLDVTMTRTTSTMSGGIVAANASNIVNSLMSLTGNDPAIIANMTKMRGVKS